MARTTGLNNASYNFEVAFGAPFDARMLCPTKADLYGGDGTTMPNPYVGMLASVTNDPTESNNGVYILVDLSGGNVESAWKRIDGKLQNFEVTTNDLGQSVLRITEINGSSSDDNVFDVLISDIAADGAQGFQGDAGAQGFQGADGVGAQGFQGAEGVGAQGFQGDTGPQGNDGQGVQGFQGERGFQGDTGAQGFQGADGVGAQGFQGDTGTGAQGFQGDTGPQGNDGQGVQGFQGERGFQGETGPQGFQGDTGAQGDLGAQGFQGDTGAQGDLGAQGFQGDTGTGAQGFQGDTGTGAQGFQGDTGAQGFQGTDGTSGNQIYNSAYDNVAGLTTVYDVGGVSAGTAVTDLDNDSNTISHILDLIFFPSVCPTTSNPSVGLSDNVSNLQVIGDSINISFTTTADGGQITNQDGTNQGVYAGDLSTSTISGPGITGSESLVVTSPYGIADYSLSSYSVQAGSQTWTLTGNFTQGPMPLNTNGGDCTSIQYAGGSDTDTTSFEGVYPVFRGTSQSYTAGQADSVWTSNNGSITDLTATGAWEAIADLTQSNPTSSLITTVNNNLDSNGLFSFTTSSTQSEGFPVEQTFSEGTAGSPPRHRFAIPSAYITAGDIYGFAPGAGGGSWFVISQWNTYSVTLTINGSAVAYTIYERSGTDAGPTKFRITFS